MSYFFCFNDPATTEIYTLSLHDALPISPRGRGGEGPGEQAARPQAERAAAAGRGAAGRAPGADPPPRPGRAGDRKSTRLNSSHANISYAVFCLKKKNKKISYILCHLMHL